MDHKSSDILYKYRLPGSTVEHTIVLPHVEKVSYDADLNTVQIHLISGSMVSIQSTTEVLYESLMKKLATFWGAE